MNKPQKGFVMDGFAVVAMLAAFLAVAGATTADRNGAGHWSRVPALTILP